MAPISQDATDQLNREFRQIVERDPVFREMFSVPMPRYRFWKHGRTTYEYTTERCLGEHGEPEGFWAVERRWTKGHGRIVRAVRFVQRRKAKVRAYAWYTKAVAVTAQRKAIRAIGEIE